MKKESGFSVIELLFVVAIVTLLAAVVVSSGYFNNSSSHGGEQLITDLATRFHERRAEVQRLNGSRITTSLDIAATPIEFDLLNLSTTASLITEGRDQGGDGEDDDTGEILTHLRPKPGSPDQGEWVFSHRQDAVSLPSDWKLVTNVSDLTTIPLIASGARGRGIPVTRIGFDGEGRALHKNEAGVWEKVPAGTSAGKKANESAFWVFYFVRPGSTNTAVALGIYPASGVTERFRYDGTAWRGFADRIPTNK